MQIAKIYEKDSKTKLVSDIFDKLLVSGFSLPYGRIELHIRDKTVSFAENEKAVICVDYNDPFVAEGDEKGIRVLLVHELFRLLFKFDLPEAVEDVIICHEMLKRGFGDDLFYLYYNRLLQARPETVEDYIKANLPWIIFSKHDKYNSELLKKQAAKQCKQKFQCKRLFDLLLDLSQKNISEAVKEYNKLVK